MTERRRWIEIIRYLLRWRANRLTWATSSPTTRDNRIQVVAKTEDDFEIQSPMHNAFGVLKIVSTEHSRKTTELSAGELRGTAIREIRGPCRHHGAELRKTGIQRRALQKCLCLSFVKWVNHAEESVVTGHPLFTLGIISLVFAVSDAPPTALMSAVGWAGYAAIIVGSVWLRAAHASPSLAVA